MHHLTYARAGHELLTDVLLLCLPCHGAEHPQHTFRTVAEIRAVTKKRRRKAVRTPAPPGVWDEINGAAARALAEKVPYVRLAVRLAQAKNRH